MSEITHLLQRAGQGEVTAANQLMPLIYDRLRAMAHRQLAKESQSMTLATTGLVHETYFELFGQTDIPWPDRAHFFRYAASAMRSILVDRARRRLAPKHGGEAERLDIADIEISIEDGNAELLDLDRALSQMAAQHPRQVKVVELRFFAGLSVEDTAMALNIDARTIKRDWQKARALLNQALGRV